MIEFIKDIPSGNRVAGLRQVVRGITGGVIEKVVIAVDADSDYMKTLITACVSGKVPYEVLASKEEIGEILGLDRSCAAVGILKQK